MLLINRVSVFVIFVIGIYSFIFVIRFVSKKN